MNCSVMKKSSENPCVYPLGDARYSINIMFIAIEAMKSVFNIMLMYSLFQSNVMRYSDRIMMDIIAARFLYVDVDWMI